MSASTLRKLLIAFLVLLVPVAWMMMRFDPYTIDGDAVNYMDIASYIHAHNWPAIVNSYWHPLYPAMLALGQMLFHPARANELGVYYFIGYVIFLLEAWAIWAFVGALVKLRARMTDAEPLLSLHAMRLLALGLLVVAAQRELSMGRIRPDALLQALMLAGFAAMLNVLASESLAIAPLIGVFFGLAFLTKSFAFTVALLSILVMVAFGLWAQRRTWAWALKTALLAVVPLVLITAPYIAAMSHKFHRLDLGDSGALNYAWYSGDTEKMHLEPSMTDEFGTATVKLTHPEQQLMQSPGMYSYRAVPFGTYPDWYDPAWFNDGVKPHMKPGPLVKRDVRNVVLVLRYVFNHPEAPVLLLLLLALGARFSVAGVPRTSFWLPMVALGLAMWAIYGLVNIEERYVTLAWLVLVLPLFAMLRADAARSQIATAMVVVFAFLALGEGLRQAFEVRRYLAPGAPVWRNPEIFGVADALAQLGVKPGDTVACMGSKACLNDYYWARLAGVQITEEIYAPSTNNLLEEWEDLPNRAEAAQKLKDAGDRVLVAYFPPLARTRETPESQGWRPLGVSGYWALPLALNVPPVQPVQPQSWVRHAEGNQ